MNVLVRLGGFFALFVTICKIIVALAGDVAVLGFIAAQSSFFYGLAGGIVIAGISRNLWIILLTIAGIFILLTYVGI